MTGLVFWFAILLIFYVYAGYPLLVTLLAFFRPSQKFQAGAHTPSVTLIIAAFNEAKAIRHKLENALNLDYPRDRLQIIVTEDGSTDDTRQIVSEFADRGVELSHEDIRQGKAASLNRGIRLSQGEILVFSDANNLFESGSLLALVAPFSDTSIGLVSGAKHIVTNEKALSAAEGLYWRYESFIKEQECRLGTTVAACGELLAIRRDLFEAWPQGIINDDFYMVMLVTGRGYRVWYAPQATSFEPVSASVQDEITRRTRMVAGRYQAMLLAPKLLNIRRPLVLWQVISHKFLRPLIPLAIIAALLANVAVVLWPPVVKSGWSGLWHLSWPFNWILLVLHIIFYILAMVGAFRPTNSRWRKILFLPTFLISSNYAALLGLVRFLRGRQTVLWEKVTRSDE